MGACDKINNLTSVLAIVSYIIALSVSQWSYGNVSSSGGISGTFQIGLWAACSDTTPTPLFTASANCRYGHCTRIVKLCPTCGVDQHGLCERGKAAEAMLLLALAFSLAALWNSGIQLLRGRAPAFGTSAACHFFALFTSLVAWALWAYWNQLINDDPATKTGSTVVGTLSLGAGFAFCVIGFLCSVFGFFFCCFTQRRQAHAESAAAGKSRAAQRNPMYAANSDNDDDSNTPAHGGNRQRPTNLKMVSVGESST